MEAHAGRGDEAGRVVVAALPAQGVDVKRVLERLLDFRACVRDRHVHGPELGELAHPPPPLTPRLGRELRAIELVPVGLEIQHGSLEPLDQRQRARRQHGGKAARPRQAEEIREVVAGGGRVLHQGGSSVGAFLRREQNVAEERPGPADELRDAKAEGSPRAERERTDQPVAPPRNVDGQLPAVAVMAPPLQQPNVQEERARPRHHANELVPAAGQASEVALRRNRLDTQAGRGEPRPLLECGGAGHACPLEEPQRHAERNPRGEQ